MSIGSADKGEEPQQEGDQQQEQQQEEEPFCHDPDAETEDNFVHDRQMRGKLLMLTWRSICMKGYRNRHGTCLIPTAQSTS